MVLPDLIQRGLSVVFCGSAVGDASAKAGAYYAGPGNKFWSTLEEVGLTSRVLAPHEYLELLDVGLGLTDLVKATAGSDSSIRFSRSDAFALESKIRAYAPRIVCFNGKRAAKEFLDLRRVEYGLQETAVGSTRLFIAPSTSAAANRWWDAAWWHELARLIQSPSF